MPNGMFGPSDIKVHNGSIFKPDSKIKNIEIYTMIAYNKDSNVFIGYCPASGRFLAYNLSKGDENYIKAYIDRMRKL